jgi:hypothetical protein
MLIPMERKLILLPNTIDMIPKIKIHTSANGEDLKKARYKMAGT